MSWLSKWIDKRSGANRAIDVDAQQERYKNAMAGTTAGYDKMMGIAEQQMDMDSELNRNMRAQMEAGASDNAAEASRLAMRAAAAGGGAPAAAMAAQTADTANRATANVQGQFMRGMQGQTENALGTMGGVLANQGQIAQAGFNMGESAMSFNKQLEQQVAQKKAGMLGGALKIAGGLAMGNPVMALGGAGQMMAQQGGYIMPQEYAVGGLVRKAAINLGKKAKRKLTQQQKNIIRRKKIEAQDKRMEEFQKNPPDDYEDIPLEDRGITMDPGLMHGGYIHKKKYKHGGFIPQGNGMSDDDSKASMLSMALGMAGPMGMMKKNSPYPGDIVDAKLEPGEYVLNRNAVNAVGKDNLDKLNNEVEPRFDDKVKLRMGGYLYG